MLTYICLGYKILSVSPSDATAFLELCRVSGAIYDDFKVLSDGSVTLRMRKKTADKVLSLCEQEDLPVNTVREGGLPKLMSYSIRRPGLWIGILMSLVLLAVSSRFVWDVRVSGNALLTEREIEETLRACGFGVGSYLGEFKADRTENKALIQDPRLAWISVNMKGTVAYVQVREAVSAPVKDTDTPTNVVADTGGQIVRVELEQGNVLVSAGKWVNKGDLLISGIYDSEQQGIRYTHAQGKVYARVVENITVTIPLTYEKKVYDTTEEAVICEKTVNFFENYIKFSKKTGNIGGSCDIIKREYVPFSEIGVDFPISLVTEWYIPYTVTEDRYTYAEAEALAYLELAKRIGSIQGGAELLSKTVTTTLGEDAYILTCSLECIRDIAKEQTFEVLP